MATVMRIAVITVAMPNRLTCAKMVSTWCVGLRFMMIPIESYRLLRKLSPARLDWLTRPNSPRENKIRKESATQLDRHSLKPKNTFPRKGQLKYRANG